MEVAIDFETYLISEDQPNPKPVCLSYAYYKTDGVMVKLESGVVAGSDIQKQLEVFKNNNAKLIAHNLKFELGVIHTWIPSLREWVYELLNEGQVHCTLLSEKLHAISENTDLNTSFSLAALVQKYFEEDISAGKNEPDAWRTRYSELDGLPIDQYPQEAYDYALQDSIYALKIFELQKNYSRDINTVRADFLLNMSGSNGIFVDMDRVNTLHSELEAILNPAYARLEELGFAVKNKDGTYKKKQKDLREWVKKNVKEGLAYSRTGAISLKGEHLSHYRPKHEILDTVLTIAEYEKILTGFILTSKGANSSKKLLECNGLIRTTYNPAVTTGRTSSSSSSFYPSVNIQQMPREVKGVSYDVRNCFRAREGFKLVSIDYSGLELCSTASQLFKVFERSEMKRLLNSGNKPIDLHSYFACKVMSQDLKREVTYEEFVANKKDKEYGRYRQICKALNLGFPGGIGYDNMRSILYSNDIDIPLTSIKAAVSEAQATLYLKIAKEHSDSVRVRRTKKYQWELVVDPLVKLKQQMFDIYPELREFLRERHEKYLNGRSKKVKNEFNEWEDEPMYNIIINGFQRKDLTYTQLCNSFLMQTPSAQGAKQMLWDFAWTFRNDPNINLLAFIHDEVVFEVRKDVDWKNYVAEVSRLMIQSMQKVLKGVRVAVEASVMTHWQKSGGEYEVGYFIDPNSTELKEI